MPPTPTPPAAAVSRTEPPVPAWLRGLPRAPEYRPTESEFADPIAFLSRVEREAAAYGICKVIPPYQRPSRRYVFAHLNRSLVSSDAPKPAASDAPNSAPSPSPAAAAVFTTRHQELGTARRGRPPPQVLKQVWQSGERYTLEQFEAKSRAFSKTHLSGLRDPTPLAVESLFWKASADRPIYIEYANDVPGSGFAASAQSRRLKKRKRESVPVDEGEKTTGWKLSSSPWNLQAIARAPGSLTRFMPDDVPGVTSPMVYIGMLFSWFAWHIEDHELHSLNFLHTGAPKTWYAVPGDRAAELEEVIRVHGYGGNPDRLASLAVLGEKTTLMSPEVLVASGLPCCRLVQYPGEFVVTFPRAYHIGFSHGFNCGEAANFATPQWLKFAKEAAVRRAVMNYLPMLSHQQLLYLLAVSFISSVKSIPIGNGSFDGTACMAGIQAKCISMDSKSSDSVSAFEGQKLDSDTDDEGDLPFDLSIDSGSLTCVACGILGYPFMAILQPSKKALEEMSLVDRESLRLNFEKGNHSNVPPCSPDVGNSGRPFIASRPSSPVVQASITHQDAKSHKNGVSFMEKQLDGPLLLHSNGSHSCSSENTLNLCINTETTETEILSDGFGTESSKQIGRGDIDSQVVKSCADSIDWNVTSAFVRPRIFCLQHALEIEELLEGKGGSHALIICHSDYTKLKALAISIAEEIEFQFDCKDVPLANASKSDLHLINISIDDEGYKEDGRDWTSQMGLNMKYFAKLRKETPGSQEQPPLSFWKKLDIADRPSPISVVPNLKWLCRKTRTPYKVVGYVSSPNAAVTHEKINPAVIKTEMGTSGSAHENGEKQGTAQQDAPLQPTRLQEADDLTDVLTCSEENDKDMHCLIDIPIALAEYPMMHQVCEGPASVSTCELDGLASVSTCDDSFCSANSQDSPVVSDEFISEQQCVQSDEVTSSTSVFVQQFLVNGSMTAEGSSNLENMGSCNVTSECQDKQLRGQQDQENIKFCYNADRNLALVATLENEENCAKTSNCCDTVLKANKSATGDLSEPHGDELQAVSNQEMPIGSIKPVQTDTSHFSAKAVKLKGNNATKLQQGYPKRTVVDLEGVEAASMTTLSGENGNPVHAGTDSLDILLGVLAEETVLSDAPGKDEVGKASLTLMTLASNDHSADAAAENEVVEMPRSSVVASLSCKGQTLSDLASDKLLGIQIPEIQQKQGNMEDVGGWNDPSFKYDRLAKKSKKSCTPMMNQYVDRPDIVSRSIGSSNRTNIICYVRRKRKRKRGSKLKIESSQSLGSFTRSPCESLRPRTKPAVIEVEETTKQTKTVQASSANKGKRTKVVEIFQCDIECCDMTFDTRADLRAHQRNICTDESCGKRFSSHKYLKRHQCVHSNARPFKCPWDGCGMTFKWSWAQTEHMRVHTGERPYKCLVPDCGQSFRYVSDYSRHRRKFNHY
ncbi:hypothetical protein BRADI_1g74997v3 [Brachypodium distachyon]|uniref:JmjC domain-containing protein n=1 Tax=Brachypodium distachyon TaxID=15368 RepID=A0A2K2DV84_BRADI|nr:hypothetical protein BRADI_1g74997v3 [Brachypodium distachyon]